MRYTRNRKIDSYCYAIRMPGLTFVEMVLAVSMTAVVSLAIFSMFNKGATVWQVVNSQSPNEDVNIFFDRFSRDMHNSFFFSKMTPRFTKDSLVMAMLVESPRLKTKTVGEVGYYFDRGEKELRRRLNDYSHISTGEEGTVGLVLRHVESAQFAYYVYDEKKKEYLWLDGFAPVTLPYAVRLEVVLDNVTTNREFKKTVTIPLGGQPQSK